MKPKPSLYTALAALVVVAAFAMPRLSKGQAGDADDQVINRLVVELSAQQSVVLENQTKIDEKLALIAEDIRIGRIYAGRAGGKAGAK